MGKKGFTLVELLVVCAVFSIIIVAIVGIYISTIKAQRYSLATQKLINESSYAMEYMSRLIRMAKKDETGECGVPAGSNFSPTGSELKFKNYKSPGQPNCERFYVGGVNQLYEERIGGGNFALTSEKFKVTNLQFYVTGENGSDNIQPKVTILLEMEATGAEPKPKIKLQTTVSQRDLDM